MLQTFTRAGRTPWMIYFMNDETSSDVVEEMVNLKIVKFTDNRKIEIVTASNADEAFDSVKKIYPDLTLSDIDSIFNYFKFETPENEHGDGHNI